MTDTNDPSRDGDERDDLGHMTPDAFKRRGYELIDAIADYLERVDELPVLPDVAPGELFDSLPEHPPESPEPWDAILRDAIGPNGLIERGLTHWQSPRFFAFFPANASGPATLADLLSTGLAVQGMLWQTSPACTEIETRMMDWMGELIGLPDDFNSTSGVGAGVIQGTASEATLVSLVAARTRARTTLGSAALDPVLYASEQAHSSVMKAAMIAGLADGPEDYTHLRLIPTDQHHAMRPDALADAINADRANGRHPIYVCATLGTTASCAVDPLARVGAIARDANAWLHVDAAYAGAALVCDEHRWMLDGIEHADTFCFNPHKWLLTNFDCDCLWTRRREELISALSLTPEYLRNEASDSGTVIDYRDWQVPLGRRFRALKLWFVMRHYGADGLRAHIRRHVAMAERFASMVRADERFEIIGDPRLALVCFRLRQDDQTNRRLLDAINASRRIYLTHASVPVGDPPASRVVIRMSIGATRTRDEHVDEAWDTIREAADAVC